MKRLNLYIVLSIMSLHGAFLQAQDSVQVLDMDDCIRIALNSSRQVLIGEDSVKITGAMLLYAYGQFLPDLNYNGVLDHSSGKNLVTLTAPTVVNSTGTTLDYQLTSTLNLFNGLHDYATLKATMLSKSAAEFNLERAKQQISLDIAQSFLQVLLDRRVLEYARQNLAASLTREEQLVKLTSVGRTALSDLYQQQTETSSDSLYWMQSEEKLRNDIILLLRKMEISETQKYRIAEAVPDSVPFSADHGTLDDLLSEALHQRPDLKSDDLYIKMSDWKIKDARSGYMPKLYLEGGLFSDGGYLNSLYLNGVDQTSALTAQEPPLQAYFGQVYGAVMLTLTWQIFDRLMTRSNVKIAKLYRRNSQINYDDLSVQISADVKTAYNDYILALQQISTASRGVISAQQAFDVLTGKYIVGRASFVDLSTAQAALLQAKVNKAQADVNLALQKKLIDFYIGK